jgi:DNA-binding NarL/FixJ family response regulator
VVTDISMPNLNGIEATYDIKKSNEKIRIVIFSMYSDKEYVLSLFRAGISGYVLKEESVSDLILALKSVKGGGTYFSKVIQKSIRHHMEDLELGDRETAREVEDGLIRLSAREKEVFPLLADGLSAREISKRLGISPKTVESHKYNIMEKLNVTSVAALTKIALRKKLIKL